MRVHRYYERLLFDPAERGRFLEDRGAALEASGLSHPEQAIFRDLDEQGLLVDAEIRRRYLMSALCRPFALTAAALGAAEGGAEALSAFLASPHLFDELGARSEAFGAHLQRLLDFNTLDLPEPLQALLGATLSLERGLVASAARLRAAAEAGEAPGAPARPTKGQLKRASLSLPPHFLAAELPVPTALIVGALDGVGPGDAWHRVESGRLDLQRLVSVSRADPAPVTVLCRGYVAGMSSERAGAGGVAPLVDVRHLRVELGGRQARLIQGLVGQRLSALPGARQELARRLAEAGVLALA
ncbi:MAG: hypothetical protein H6740_01790 [Alphaproteobacteria bacterium]|nr:hypothetical protein [Alphaproteobacteria bacterium]